jgi:hypothetical protein
MHLTERNALMYEQRVVSEGSEAAGAPELFDESESTTLCFRTPADAFNYAVHSAEYVSRVFPSKRLESVDFYIEGKITAEIGI